jgi:hypothetical protein
MSPTDDQIERLILDCKLLADALQCNGIPAVQAWKSYTKRAVLWLYAHGLLSLRATQRTIDRLGLRLA